MANVIRLKRASGSDPAASDLVSGEPAVRTDTGELFFKKDDGSIAKVAGAGGGPDFKYLALRNAANNGAASFPNADFTLVTSGTTSAITPTAANTLLVSVNGVIQKPNTGTSTPSQGFALSGSTIKFGANISAAPDFILYQESGGIGEPSDDTVSEVKLKVSNSPVNGYFLSAQSGNNGGLTWAAPVATSCTGNSATATALATARTINGTSFDGTANITVTAAAGTLTGNTLNSSVTASSLTSLGDLSGLTVTGNLAVDTNTLFVNASTNRVGIGTTSPVQTLDVTGSNGVGIAEFTNTETSFSNDCYTLKIDSSAHTSNMSSAGAFAVDVNSGRAMTINGFGRVGIGTTSPRSLLDLGAGSGDGSLSTTLSQYQIMLEAPQGADDYGRNIGWSVGTNGLVAAINAVDVGGNDATGLTFITGNNTAVAERMRINSNGAVMVGGTLQASTNGGLNVEVTDSGNERVPLSLINQGTADGSGVIISHRGKDDAGNQQDYNYIRMVADDTSSGSEDGSIRFWTLGGGTLGERLRIDSSGDVGIGTTSPARGPLHVHENSSSDCQIHLTNNDTGSTSSDGLTIFTDTDTSGIWSREDVDFQIATNGTERLRIRSNGKVLIGTTSPQNNANADDLVVATGGHSGITIRSGTSHNGSIFFADGTTGADEYRGWVQYTHTSNYLTFGTNASERLRIDSSGNVGIGNDSPSCRLAIKDVAEHTAYASVTPSVTESMLQLYNNPPNETANDHATIQFGVNGGSHNRVNSISAVAESAGNRKLAFTFCTDEAGSRAEKMRITGDGNVGIGTSSPSNLLTISAGNPVLELQGTTTNGGNTFLHINANANHWCVGADNFTSQNLFVIKSGTPDSSTHRFAINPSGNVGIGTTSPATRLEVKDNASNNLGTTIRLSQGYNSVFSEIASNFGGSMTLNAGQGTTSAVMHFQVNDDEKMRITNDGKLRIGTSLSTAAAGKFQVVEEGGGNQSNDCNAYFETNANDWNIKTYYNSPGTHYHLVFLEQGTIRGSIKGNDGSNVTYNQGSDYRWKENITDLSGSEGIEICKKLKPRKYNWIENREVTGDINTVDGFIAHEVEEAGVLGAVTGEKDAVNEDGSIDGQMLDYGQMTPVLAAAIKGLIARVEALEAN